MGIELVDSWRNFALKTQPCECWSENGSEHNKKEDTLQRRVRVWVRALCACTRTLAEFVHLTRILHIWVCKRFHIHNNTCLYQSIHTCIHACIHTSRQAHRQTDEQPTSQTGILKAKTHGRMCRREKWAHCMHIRVCWASMALKQVNEKNW